MGPNYTGTGKEPLRSDPRGKASPAPTTTFPLGKPAHGTANLRAYEATKSSAALRTPTKTGNDWPGGVQTFTDDRV